VLGVVVLDSEVGAPDGSRLAGSGLSLLLLHNSIFRSIGEHDEEVKDLPLSCALGQEHMVGKPTSTVALVVTRVSDFEPSIYFATVYTIFCHDVFTSLSFIFCQRWISHYYGELFAGRSLEHGFTTKNAM